MNRVPGTTKHLIDGTVAIEAGDTAQGRYPADRGEGAADDDLAIRQFLDREHVAAAHIDREGAQGAVCPDLGEAVPRDTADLAEGAADEQVTIRELAHRVDDPVHALADVEPGIDGAAGRIEFGHVVAKALEGLGEVSGDEGAVVRANGDGAHVGVLWQVLGGVGVVDLTVAAEAFERAARVRVIGLQVAADEHPAGAVDGRTVDPPAGDTVAVADIEVVVDLAVGLQAGDPLALLLVDRGELAADEDLAVIVERDGIDLLVGALADLEILVFLAVDFHAGDVGVLLAVVFVERAADDDLPVRLDSDGVEVSGDPLGGVVAVVEATVHADAREALGLVVVVAREAAADDDLHLIDVHPGTAIAGTTAGAGTVAGVADRSVGRLDADTDIAVVRAGLDAEHGEGETAAALALGGSPRPGCSSC